MTFNRPRLGVIEGFYGRSWSAEARLQMASWLPGLGIDSYLYAPKNDPFLRKRWREPWPDDQRAELAALAARCRESGLGLYFGLSPYALYAAYGAAEREQLRRRLDEILSLGPEGIAILFDDMPGDTDALAERQLDIIQDAAAVVGDSALLICPTYYSDDPVLDRFFGARPAAYLESLSAGLSASVGVFWTGPEVCSTRIPEQHLRSLDQRCKQPLHLWDNYPVNDSKARSPHLYMEDLAGRDAHAAPLIAGHWCNAMNQPALSIPALASLPRLYGREPGRWREVYAEAGLSEELIAACRPLSRNRLEDLTPEQHRKLERASLGATPASKELADWLAGVYEFDPACLTD